jgi:hypothetical protein
LLPFAACEHYSNAVFEMPHESGSDSQRTTSDGNISECDEREDKKTESETKPKSKPAAAESHDGARAQQHGLASGASVQLLVKSSLDHDSKSGKCEKGSESESDSELTIAEFFAVLRSTVDTYFDLFTDIKRRLLQLCSLAGTSELNPPSSVKISRSRTAIPGVVGVVVSVCVRGQTVLEANWSPTSEAEPFVETAFTVVDDAFVSQAERKKISNIVCAENEFQKPGRKSKQKLQSLQLDAEHDTILPETDGASDKQFWLQARLGYCC